MTNRQPAQLIDRTRLHVDPRQVDGLRLLGSAAAQRGSKCAVARLAEHAPEPVGLSQVGERDRRSAGLIVDTPGQHGAADFKDRDQGSRRDQRTGAPQTRIGDQFHPATCSIALIR